jgi:hypothetical protein
LARSNNATSATLWVVRKKENAALVSTRARSHAVPVLAARAGKLASLVPALPARCWVIWRSGIPPPGAFPFPPTRLPLRGPPPAPHTPGCCLFLPNLLKDRLLHAVLCRISILILFLPKPPNRETTTSIEAPTFPILPFAALPNSRVNSSFDDSETAPRRLSPSRAEPAARQCLCLSDVFDLERVASARRNLSDRSRLTLLPKPAWAPAPCSLRATGLCVRVSASQKGPRDHAEPPTTSSPSRTLFRSPPLGAPSRHRPDTSPVLLCCCAYIRAVAVYPPLVSESGTTGSSSSF